MTIQERAHAFIEQRTIQKQAHQLAAKCYINGAKEQQDVLIKKIKEYLSMEPYGVTDMCSELEEDLIKYLEDEK